MDQVITNWGLLLCILLYLVLSFNKQIIMCIYTIYIFLCMCVCILQISLSKILISSKVNFKGAEGFCLLCSVEAVHQWRLGTIHLGLPGLSGFWPLVWHNYQNVFFFSLQKYCGLNSGSLAHGPQTVYLACLGCFTFLFCSIFSLHINTFYVKI